MVREGLTGSIAVASPWDTIRRTRQGQRVPPGVDRSGCFMDGIPSPVERRVCLPCTVPSLRGSGAGPSPLPR